jgi:hypothetical protein
MVTPNFDKKCDIKITPSFVKKHPPQETGNLEMSIPRWGVGKKKVSTIVDDTS